MSREFHVVSPEMWSDDRFLALSDDAKLLWIRLLTGPEATVLPGIIVIGRLALAEAMRWPTRKVDQAFRQFAVTHEGHPVPMAIADWHARVLWLPRACWHRRRPKNPNEVTSWRDFWKVVPDCALRREHFEVLRVYLTSLGAGFVQAFDSFANSTRIGFGNSGGSNVATLPELRNGTTSEQPSNSLETSSGSSELVSSSRARVRSESPSLSASGSLPERSTQQEARQGSTAAPPPSGTSTAPPADIELTQELRDECVMNGWPEPTRDHVQAFLQNARSKGQVYADWNARFKWWMCEEKKRMGRGYGPASAKAPRKIVNPAHVDLDHPPPPSPRPREAPRALPPKPSQRAPTRLAAALPDASAGTDPRAPADAGERP